MIKRKDSLQKWKKYKDERMKDVTFAKEYKAIQPEIDVIRAEDVFAISERFIKQNMEAYKVLAKYKIRKSCNK